MSDFLESHRAEHSRWEKKLLAACRRAFAAERDAVLKKLPELTSGVEKQALPLEVEAERFLEEIQGPLRDAFLAFGKRVGKVVGLSADPVEQAADRWVREYGLELSKSIGETTKTQLREQLAEGLAAGEGIEALAERVKSVYDQADKIRAYTIARTEVTAAATMGCSAAYRLAGMERYIWYTAADERVCELCGPLHEKEFDIGSGPVGAKLPGPPRHPRCRCVILGVLKLPKEEEERPPEERVLEPGFDPTGLRRFNRMLAEGLGLDSPTLATQEVRSKVKDEICRKLAERLEGDPDVQRLLREFNRATVYDVVDHLIRTWATTSADRHFVAIAMQLAAEKEFGLKDCSHPWARLASENVMEMAQTLFKANEAGLRKFLRAQYEITQEWLRKRGIKEVYAVRGMSFERAPAELSGEGLRLGKVQLQPMSSFSFDFETAKGFSGYGEAQKTLIMVKIPRERILATSRTGYGCLVESEIVVLGGRGSCYAWGTKERPYITVTAEEVAEAIKTFKPPAKKREPDYIDLDAELHNADWTKRTWDLPPRDSDEFREFLEASGMTEEEFDRLPAARLPKAKERRKR